MSATRRFDLHADRKGAGWDLLLYVPTVLALASMAVALWFGEDRRYSYLMGFLASFFFLVGANRILKTRLMVLPAAPVGLDIDQDAVAVRQRRGSTVDLVKDQRCYPDLAGRSFGLAGLDRSGRRLQFIFHRGQFADEAAFRAARESLERLRRGKN